MSFRTFDPNENESRDLELALWVEQAEPDDPYLLQLLTEQYAEELFRFNLTVIANREDNKHAVEKASFATCQVLVSAIDDLESFRGKESVRSWLFGLATKVCRALQSRN
jgi:DNA-directed RNA polymerase specialized sigma24 family protein